MYKVNYRGVEITPQITHTEQNKDILLYEYNGFRLMVTVDTQILSEMPNVIKDYVIQELEENNVL